MAQSTTINAPADEWTEITDGNVTSITFLVKRGKSPVYFEATASAEPAGGDGDVSKSIPYNEGQGEKAVALTELFPGVTSPARVFVHPVGDDADIFVSNA